MDCAGVMVTPPPTAFEALPCCLGHGPVGDPWVWGPGIGRRTVLPRSGCETAAGHLAVGFCLPAAKTSRPGELVSNAGRAQCPARRLPAQRLALPDPPGSSPASQRRPPAWELSAGPTHPSALRADSAASPMSGKSGLKTLALSPMNVRVSPG